MRIHNMLRTNADLTSRHGANILTQWRGTLFSRQFTDGNLNNTIMNGLKISIPICLSVLCLTTAAHAQSDNIQDRSDSASQIPYENKDDVLYKRISEYSPVKPEDVPQALRTTLKQRRYSGWQKGQLLQAADNKTYELRMGAGDKAVVYHFDANGKAIE